MKNFGFALVILFIFLALLQFGLAYRKSLCEMHGMTAVWYLNGCVNNNTKS